MKSNRKILRKRTHAFTIDLFMIILLNKILMHAQFSFLKTIFYHFNAQTQMNIINSLEVVHLSLLGSIFFGYFFISYYLGEGQTIGKMIMGLRLVSNKRTKELNFLEAILRPIGYFTCFLGALTLFAIPFLRKDGKGLPDWFSNTSVVDEKEHISEGQMDNIINFPPREKDDLAA